MFKINSLQRKKFPLHCKQRYIVRHKAYYAREGYNCSLGCARNSKCPSLISKSDSKCFACAGTVDAICMPAVSRRCLSGTGACDGWAEGSVLGAWRRGTAWPPHPTEHPSKLRARSHHTPFSDFRTSFRN